MPTLTQAVKNCGTGAGGFKPGNSCAHGGDGPADVPLHPLTTPAAVLGDVPVPPHQFAAYLSKYGQEWKPGKLPKGVPMGEPKSCFMNASRLVLDDPDKYSYCEGIAYAHGVPQHLGFLHAWAVTKSGKVVDNTWEHPEKAVYFGVKYDYEKYMKHLVVTGMYGIFGGDTKTARKVIERGGI